MTELDFTFERQIELERNSALQQGIEQGIEQGILVSIEMLSDMNVSYDDILENVIQRYNLEPAKAKELMDKNYK